MYFVSCIFFFLITFGFTVCTDVIAILNHIFQGYFERSYPLWKLLLLSFFVSRDTHKAMDKKRFNKGLLGPTGVINFRS